MLDRTQCQDKLQKLYPNLWKGIKLDWWHRKHSDRLSGSEIQYWLTEDGYTPFLAGLDNLVRHALTTHTDLPVRTWLKSGFSDPDQFWPKITELAVLQALDMRGCPVLELDPKVGARKPDFRFQLQDVEGRAEVASLDWRPGRKAEVIIQDTLSYVFRELPGNTVVNFEGGLPAEDDEILEIYEGVKSYVLRHGTPARRTEIKIAGWPITIEQGACSGYSSSIPFQGGMMTGEGSELDRLSHWKVLKEKREQLGDDDVFKVMFLGVTLRAQELIPQLMYWAMDENGQNAAGPYKFFRDVDTDGRVTIIVIAQVFLPSPHNGELQAFSFPNVNSPWVQQLRPEFLFFLNHFPWVRTG